MNPPPHFYKTDATIYPEIGGKIGTLIFALTPVGHLLIVKYCQFYLQHSFKIFFQYSLLQSYFETVFSSMN